MERELMPDLILLLICVGEDLPVSVQGKKRNRTGKFRGETSPEKPTGAVTSLEEEPGQTRVFQDLTTGSCQHFHVLLQYVPLLFSSQSWIVQEELLLPGSPRKFWAICPPHFPLRRDFCWQLG